MILWQNCIYVLENEKNKPTKNSAMDSRKVKTPLQIPPFESPIPRYLFDLCLRLHTDLNDSHGCQSQIDFLSKKGRKEKETGIVELWTLVAVSSRYLYLDQ